MIYYISDTHFNDINVFNKCSRPFKDLKEMKETIIKNYNGKVKNNDHVYILGDLAKDDSIEAIDIIQNLNGHKHLLIGNHDLQILDYIIASQIFETIDFMILIEDNNRKVCLCHYPVMDWMEFNRGGYHVYGHIHNKTEKNSSAYIQIKDYFKDKLAFNCGVDVTGFQPVTLDEMILLKEKNKNEPYIN